MQVIESSFMGNNTTSRTPLPLKLTEELIAAILLNCDFSDSDHCMEQLSRWKGHIRTSRGLLENWPEEECCK